MPLTPGARLGPYEILAPLGQGGMGEVYRAHDSRLGRDVAVKVLPSHLAIDPDARARFERESRAIATLSHPNILAIHDVGTADGTAYAVTELLEGETLRARLEPAADAHTALPASKAIEFAVQIAQGLAAAHDKGIVHRDLKPENIFISSGGQVKILDFGLARSVVRRSNSADTPTELQATDPGMVMGTVGYMSPEQVKGQVADHRADIFSFGCVLYEMLTGRRAFRRETAAETMTAILREDPPATAPGSTDLPPALASIVRHCLEKQPDERFQSVRDLAFALQSIAGSASGRTAGMIAPQARPRFRPWAWIAVTVVVAAVTGLAAWWMPRAPIAPEGAAIRAVLPLPGVALRTFVGKDDATIALSPDGHLLAYINPTRSAIELRDLETSESRVLAEGGEVGAPIFSPDGRFVAFVQGGGGTIRTAVSGAIRRIAVTGGAATTVVDGIIGLKGAAWGDDGWIYYCPAPAMGLWRVRAEGGAPEKLTDPDTANGEKTHRLPFVLPGSRAVLFVVGTTRITTFDDARIEALRLSDKSRHRLVDGGTAPMYLPTGHLLYERAGQLIAIPFDSDRLAVHGAPVTLADGIADLPQTGVSYHAVSSGGTLFFIPRTKPPSAAIVTLDRQGRATRLADAPYAIDSGRVSPDGRRIAVDPDGATQQIAIIDLARSTSQRVTYEWDNASPIWTPDGSHLVFRSNAGGGNRHLFLQAADGSGVAEPLTTSASDEIPTTISGRMVAYEVLDPTTKNDLWVMSLDDRKPQVLVKTPFDETGARFSPDGHWIAYQSNQSGAWEIYVQAYPGNGRRQQASEGGGVRPEWQPDGRSLTYLKGPDVMSVAIVGGTPGPVVKLFSLEPNDVVLDVMHDGRLVVLRRAGQDAVTSLNLIVNWFADVRRRAGR